MIEQALLSPNDAAKYLGVSRSYFDDHLRPHIPMLDLRAPGAKQPVPRFERVELDAFIAKRRRSA